jgi:hypothetical protein
MVAVLDVSIVHGQPSGELVSEQQQLQFFRAFWSNLHSVLWAEAWVRRPAKAEPSPAGTLPERLTAAITPAERRAWDEAVEYYDREIADLHPLFDRESSTIRKTLIAAGAELPATGLRPAHRKVLVDAADVYRKYLWGAHDRANREWIAAALSKIDTLTLDVPQRLSRLYGTPWFSGPVRVDVVRVSSREGAFTSNDPAPGHVTLSSSSPGSQEWAAAEVVLHEASHLLFLPVMSAFAAEVQAQGKNTRRGPVESWNANVWHAALFYATGEVVRQALDSRGIVYVPYVYKNGLFDRTWPQFREPIETNWKPFVNGERSREDAIKQIVMALR